MTVLLISCLLSTERIHIKDITPVHSDLDHLQTQTCPFTPSPSMLTLLSVCCLHWRGGVVLKKPLAATKAGHAASPSMRMPSAPSQIFTSSYFQCTLTLAVAEPPPQTGLTFPTSTGPQLCVSVSCVCSRCRAQILIRAASSVYTRRRTKNAVKY